MAGMKCLLFCLVVLGAVSAVAGNNNQHKGHHPTEKKLTLRGVFKADNINSTEGFPASVTSYQVGGGLLYDWKESNEAKFLGFLNSQYTTVKSVPEFQVYLTQGVLVFPGKGKITFAGDSSTFDALNANALTGGTGVFKYIRGEAVGQFLARKNFKFSDSVIEAKIQLTYIL